MTTPTDYRAALAKLLQCIEDDVIECNDGKRFQALVEDARALLAGPEARPPAATSPQTLRPVDRYTLGETILASWHKHGNDSWCSIADEVIAALAAPEAVGVADEVADLVTALRDPHRWETLTGDHLNRAADLLSSHGTAHPAPVPVGHPDDEAVDRFAAAMKEKLARKRDQGYSGWQTASADFLSQLLHEHLSKGDPVDIGNFAMMLHQNNQPVVTLQLGGLDDRGIEQAFRLWWKDRYGDLYFGAAPLAAIIEWTRHLTTCPSPAPVPVGERPWEREGWCDDEGRCWWWRSDGVDEFWEFICLRYPVEHIAKLPEHISYGPCLPHWALPLPEGRQ